jgi:hypothetical protein
MPISVFKIGYIFIIVTRFYLPWVHTDGWGLNMLQND